MIEAETNHVKNIQKEASGDPTEADEAMAKLTVLANQQSILEECWKPVRWLFDILSRFRNRQAASGITFAALKEWYLKQTDFPDDTAVFANSPSSSTNNANPTPNDNEESLIMVINSRIVINKIFA